MRALARRDDRLARIKEKRERMQQFLAASTSASEYSTMGVVERVNAGDVAGTSGVILQSQASSTDDSGPVQGSLRLIDTELLALAEKQRKRSKNWSTAGENDHETGDIHHQPIITMMFLVTTILATTVISFLSGNTLMTLLFGVLLSMLFVGARTVTSKRNWLEAPGYHGH